MVIFLSILMKAEWYHLLLIIFAFLEIKREKDLGYSNIKELVLKPLVKYIIGGIPLLLSFMYSNDQLEHLFAAYAYLIAYNKILSLLNDQAVVGNKIFPLTILSLLISYNYSIIPRTDMNIAIVYTYILTVGLIFIATRDINSPEMFQTILMSHISFFISK